MRRRIVLLLAALALAGCAKSSSGPGSGPADSGIQGKVLLGPTCPVERQNSPCPDRPFQADIQVLQAGNVVATTHSAADGTFRVLLAPGHYTLHPVSPTPNGLPFGRDVQADVRAHAFTQVTVAFDTGIR